MTFKTRFLVIWCLWDLCLAWRPGVLLEETKRTALFEKLAEGMSLQGYVLAEEIVQSEMQCIHKCISNPQCQSINYQLQLGLSQLCQLNKETRLSKPEGFIQRHGIAYYSWENTPCAIHNPCKHGGTCLPDVNDNRVFYKCACVIGYSGDICETYQGFHFKFSNVSAKEHVSLPVVKPLEAFTVSVWLSASNVGSGNMSTLFSYATQKEPGLVVFKFDDEGNLHLVVNGTSRTVQYFPLTDNVWHHVSVTWEKISGGYTVYYDGLTIGSGTGHQAGLTVEGGGVVTLGQTQAAASGEFEPGQAFLGNITSFNMWDYILSEKSIREFSSAAKCEGSYGNIVAWTSFSEGNKDFTSSPRTIVPTDCSFVDPKSSYDVVFPRRSDTDFVIKTALTSLVALTISFYVNYTSSGDQSFVSYATENRSNEIAVLQKNGKFLLWIFDLRSAHNFIVPNDSKWHNVVITWSNKDGGYAIFLNGVKKASRKLAESAGKTIPGSGKLAIGNDQDTLGGGWKIEDAFVGSITRLNVWNVAVSSDVAAKIARHCGKESGNVFPWKEFRQGTFNGEAKIREPSLCAIP